MSKRHVSKFYSYPDLHHLHGGVKFATQISTLLNFFLYWLIASGLINDVMNKFSQGELVPYIVGSRGASQLGGIF